MEKLYWFVEYLKVFLGYMVLFYIWPCIVFRKYLRGKGKIFRFLFCSTVQVVLINTTVLGLGILHILNEWIIRGIFYGVFICSLGKSKMTSGGMLCLRRNLTEGNFERRLSLIYIKEYLIQKGKKIWSDNENYISEYILMIILLMFGMAYFSHSAFQHFSYGCNDEYMHHDWILGLQNGEIFSGKIYPEGMHCFIYCLHNLFGIKLYSCILFLAGIHIMTLLAAVYCLFREVYLVRYTPLLVLTAFLTVDGMGWGKTLEGMSRLTWTLPQEFGLYLIYLCTLFLIRFFREDKEKFCLKQWYRDENLFLLALGVSGVVSIHFYVMILTFFSCLAVVLACFKKILSIKRISMLSVAVLSGLLLGSMPMVLACLTGKKIQGSMYWGMSLIVKDDSAKLSYSAEKEQPLVSVTELFKSIFDYGYVSVYGRKNAVRILVISLMVIIILCGYYLLIYRRKRDCDRFLSTRMLTGYFFCIISSVIFVFLYAAPSMNLPELVYAERIVSINKIMALGVIGVLVDFTLALVIPRVNRKKLPRRIVFGCGVIFLLAYFFDYHEYLYWSLKRYNAEVSVTNEIVQQYSKYSYKIISMWDEAYQLDEAERHEELIDFMQHIEEDEYYISEEYIFVYVEKRPLLRGQTHFLVGPDWLADQTSLFWDHPKVSQCPNIIHAEISEEMANEQVEYKKRYLDNYNDLEIRTILSSKAYYWCEDFVKRCPKQIQIYYEDDDFVCYVIHQNPDLLLNLAQSSE